MASTQILICVANILVILSAASEAHRGENESSRYQVLKHYEPHFKNLYQSKCLTKIQGIPLCQFLSKLGLFKDKNFKVIPADTSIIVSGKPELIIKKQLIAELHIPLTTNCDTKKEKKILKFQKIRRPKIHKKGKNIKLVLKKIRGPKKISFEPINSENFEVLNFKKIRRPEHISFKTKHGNVSEVTEVVTSHKINRPKTTTFKSKNELLEDVKELELQKIHRPNKNKFNQKNKKLPEEEEEKLVNLFHKITRPKKIVLGNESEDKVKLNKIKRPTKIVFEPKDKKDETAVTVAVDEENSAEEESKEKTEILKPENLKGTDSSEDEVNHKVEKVTKLKNIDDSEEKGCGSGECGKNYTCKCDGQVNDSLENYDDYITEEHDKCGCKGKDVVDYDTTEVGTETKDNTEDILKEQTTEVVPVSEEETSTVKQTPCDEKLYNLLLIIAPKLSRKLKMASDILASSGSRSANPFDPDFLKKLQRMATVSSPADIASPMKTMSPLPVSDRKHQ